MVWNFFLMCIHLLLSGLILHSQYGCLVRLSMCLIMCRMFCFMFHLMLLSCLCFRVCAFVFYNRGFGVCCLCVLVASICFVAVLWVVCMLDVFSMKNEHRQEETCKLKPSIETNTNEQTSQTQQTNKINNATTSRQNTNAD